MSSIKKEEPNKPLTSRVTIITNNIDIPLSCPVCGGRMYAVRLVAPLKVLKERGWQICKECRFSRTVEDFKRVLLTV